MSTVYQNPEEKLWYVIKHFHTSSASSASARNGGIRLEKNDIVKFGRVRLRVRDIDYADKETPITPQQIGTNNAEQPRVTQDDVAQNGQSVDVNDVDIQLRSNSIIGNGNQVRLDQFENVEGVNPDSNLMQSTTRKKHLQ